MRLRRRKESKSSRSSSGAAFKCTAFKASASDMTDSSPAVRSAFNPPAWHLLPVPGRSCSNPPAAWWERCWRPPAPACLAATSPWQRPTALAGARYSSTCPRQAGDSGRTRQPSQARAPLGLLTGLRQPKRVCCEQGHAARTRAAVLPRCCGLNSAPTGHRPMPPSTRACCFYDLSVTGGRRAAAGGGPCRRASCRAGPAGAAAAGRIVHSGALRPRYMVFCARGMHPCLLGGARPRGRVGTAADSPLRTPAHHADSPWPLSTLRRARPCRRPARSCGRPACAAGKAHSLPAEARRSRQRSRICDAVAQQGAGCGVEGATQARLLGHAVGLPRCSRPCFVVPLLTNKGMLFLPACSFQYMYSRALQ